MHSITFKYMNYFFHFFSRLNQWLAPIFYRLIDAELIGNFFRWSLPYFKSKYWHFVAYIWYKNIQVVNKPFLNECLRWAFSCKPSLSLFLLIGKPICAQRTRYSTFDQKFNFNLRRDPRKNFLWASHLWVGRRKEPILSYVTKNDEVRNRAEMS